MSTRSLIAVEQQDGTYNTIYCHFDGYVEGGVGEELFKKFGERADVENLISLGDRRALVDTLPEEDLYNEPYGKYSLEKLKRQLDMIDYIYIFNLSDEWIVISDIFGQGKVLTKKLSDFFK